LRPKILARTRRILLENLPIVKDWVAEHSHRLSFATPKAGAIAFVKYTLGIDSTQLAERLVKEKSTLVVPGDQFRMGRYMRIGYGVEKEYLRKGLGRVGALIESIEA
jgi:aspartate/methionine/tyrosine aminotransferase